MPTGSGPTSPTPPNNTSGVDKNSGSKLSTMSYDPTPYIQRARVTRPAPPKPSVNPMQFVQIKPCSLYQSAQEQLKRAEEVKKVKEIKKEEPEDWQSNLDNWKSSRRKRVEHIIDRVVEVKKLEMEEHDRTRRKSKTFSEMLEERGSRRKLSALAVYTEDESNDFSDLGIGMSSASGKSSLSEDYDNHSVMSDNVDTEKPAFDTDNNSNHGHENGSGSRDYISSPGYDTSSSTAPASSPDPCEYTYEGAIQDYKTRVSRAQSGCYNNGFRSPYSKDSTPERSTSESYLNRHISSSKIEDRLLNFEVKCINEHSSENTSVKKDLPKVDILKRRELFEKESTTHTEVGNQKRFSGDFSQSKSIRERLSSLGKKSEDTKKSTRLPGDIVNIKDRLQNLEKQSTISEKPTKIDVPVLPLKDRLSSLQSAVAKEEVKKPVLLVDEHQLEILKKEELEKQHHLKREAFEDENLNSSQEILNINDELNLDTDREDSGIHTTDVSCSVSQTDEQPDLVNEESHHHINEDNLYQTQQQRVDVNDNQSKVNKATIPDVVCNVDPKNTTNSTKKEVPEKEPPSISREPVIDREASVSLSLSNSSCTSIQTVKSNDNLTNDIKDAVSPKAPLQHSVEANAGSFECNKFISPHVVNTNHSTFNTNTHINHQTKPSNEYYTNSTFNVSNDPNVGRRYLIYDSKQAKGKADDHKIQKNNKVGGAIQMPQQPLQNFKIGEGNLPASKQKVESAKGIGVCQQPVKSEKLSESGNLSENKENLSNISIEQNCRQSVVNNEGNENSNSPQDKQTLGNIEDTKTSQIAETVKPTENLVENRQKPQNVEIVGICQQSAEIKERSEFSELPKLKENVENKSDHLSKLKESVENEVNSHSTKPKVNSNTSPDLNSKCEENPNANTDNKERRKTVVEICEKANVNDSPELAYLPTPYFDIDFKDISNEEANKISNLTYENVKKFNQEKKTPLSPSKDQSSESPKNGLIVAKLEVVETKIKVTSNDTPPKSPKSSSPTSPVSPMINPKTHPATKPKNIFEFLKKNFNSESSEEDLNIPTVEVDNSKFYVPLTKEKQNNEVNIEITRTTTTEKIVEQTDSDVAEIDITSEINQLLDEELSKLTTEDTKL